jgi:predicted ATP-dependent protease
MVYELDYDTVNQMKRDLNKKKDVMLLISTTGLSYYTKACGKELPVVKYCFIKVLEDDEHVELITRCQADKEHIQIISKLLAKKKKVYMELPCYLELNKNITLDKEFTSTYYNTEPFIREVTDDKVGKKPNLYISLSLL